MENFAKQFLDKLCLIYMMTGNSSTVTGTIKEVQNGGILVEDESHQLQVLNLDYVTRIREYPTGKNGKKKSFVMD